MKKIIIMLLAVSMLVSVLILTGCGGEKAENAKLGLGVYSYYSKATDATEDVNGAGEVYVTAAAVLIGSDGKILACKIDAMQNTVAYTSKGEYAAASAFRTKAEQGTDYGMVKYGNAKKEWFEQIAALESVAVDKTVDEVKKLVVESTSKGNDEVVGAGCTIMISDFIHAIEKAFDNVKDSNAVKGNTLDIGFVATQSGANASEDVNGNNSIDTVIVAAARNADGKVTAMSMDSVQTAFAFDSNGASKTDIKTALTTKKELGDNYGMSKYGQNQDRNGDGKVLEWYAQAEAFETFCTGKTSDEISASVLDTGYGIEGLQSAGCTVSVSDFIAAAIKAIK